MRLLLSVLPTRGILVVPWIVGLAALHCIVRWRLAVRDGRELPRSIQLAHEGHWFGASLVVLGGTTYEPILRAFVEVPWYLGIAAFALSEYCALEYPIGRVVASYLLSDWTVSATPSTGYPWPKQRPCRIVLRELTRA